MDYDLNLQWERNTISLLEYVPTWTGRGNAVTSLILDFKNNIPRAVRVIEDLAIQAFEQSEDDLLAALDTKYRYIVSIPSSSSEHPNLPCEDLCSTLAARFNWLTYLPQALVRTVTVPKSATARRDGRPRTTYQEHVRTIQYRRHRIISSQSFILVDDIITYGETSRACRAILKQTTNCKNIVNFFVGRTVS